MEDAGRGLIEVQVRFLGRFAALHPAGRTVVRLTEGSGISALLAELEHETTWKEATSLEEAVSEGSIRLIVNGRYTAVSDQRRLQTGDVVALASPVAGGQEIRRAK